MILIVELILALAFATRAGVPATGPSQLPAVELTWHLDSVDFTSGRTFATFAIHTVSERKIVLRGYDLYFNQLAGVLADPEGNVHFTHIAGDLFVAKLPRMTLRKARPFRISVVYETIVDRTSDAPKGPYLAKGSEFRRFTRYSFSGFDDPQLLEAYGTPAPERYEKNTRLALLPPDSLSIVPKPAIFQRREGLYVAQDGLSIYFRAPLEGQGHFLIEEMSKRFGIEVYRAERPDRADILLTIDRAMQHEEAYRVDVSDEGIILAGGGLTGVHYSIRTFLKLLAPAMSDAPARTVHMRQYLVEDQPRFGYRGLHLDISRHFFGPEEIRRVIDLMAEYKLNRLHLTLANDEGWRLEIPGLPELTRVGSRRGHTLDESDRLFPAYGSGPDCDEATSGCGFLSRTEFIALLTYANFRGVRIIPELDMPGHARAAIRSMMARHAELSAAGDPDGAAEYLLHDPGDRSKYISAQNYSDNVMCACRESTYRFIEKVISELDAMYADAGLELEVMHCGGDELPVGAWSASPLCDQWMRTFPSIGGVNGIYPYFLSRLLDIAGKFNIRIAGWEEVALMSDSLGHNTTSINHTFAGSGVVPYVWNAVAGWGREDMGYRLANAGYSVVLCNSAALYFDMAYGTDPQEPGLTWSGYTDTESAFAFEPAAMFVRPFASQRGEELSREYWESKVALHEDSIANIMGIQGQLWTETVATTGRLEYMLFPKMLGLAERAWSQEPAWVTAGQAAAVEAAYQDAWNDFANRVGQIELPFLRETYAVNYRLPRPGAAISKDSVYFNIAFPGIPVYYSYGGEYFPVRGPVARAGKPVLFKAGLGAESLVDSVAAPGR